MVETGIGGCGGVMSGFTKLDSSLIASSVWSEPDKTRIVWITMLAMADRNGDVKASIVGLAHQAREPLEDTIKAIETLSLPDPFSGRKEMEGRRILPIEGGWHLVTHAHYRQSLRIEEKREQTRKRVQKYRGKSVTQRYAALPSASASVSVSSSNKKCSQKEAEEFCRSLGLPRSDGTAMWLHWEEKGWAKVKDWKLTIRKWESFGYLPSQKNGKYPKPTRADYKRNYLPPAREVTDEELAEQRRIAAEEKAKLRTELNR